MDRLPQEIYDEIAELLSETHKERLWKTRSAAYLSRVSSEDLESLSGVRLAPLAALSRRWQKAVEKQTFRNIVLSSTELGHFERLFVGSRRHNLRAIDYAVVLPPYGSEAAKERFERAHDRRVNDESFTKAMKELFRILAAWNDCPAGSVSLDMGKIHSPDDGLLAVYRRQPDSTNVQSYVINQRPGLGNNRFRFSVLQLLHVEELPVVPVIGRSSEHMGGIGSGPEWALSRRLGYTTVLDIMTRLPCLKQAVDFICDREIAYPAQRRSYLAALAGRLVEVVPAAIHLEMLHLCIRSGDITDHTWRPSDLRPRGETKDPFSTAVHQATAHHPSLRILHLMGFFDESLFGSDRYHDHLYNGKVLLPSSAPRQLFWQNLRSLNVIFHMTSPSGHWYFKSSEAVVSGMAAFGQAHGPASETLLPPGYDDDEAEDGHDTVDTFDGIRHRIGSGQEEKYFRYEPDEEHLVPFLTAFAHACLQIPPLEKACIKTIFRTPVLRDTGKTTLAHDIWGIFYFGPGVDHGPFIRNHEYALDKDRQRLLWDVKHWRPDSHVRALFQAIGRESHGDDLAERRVNTFETVWKPKYS